MRIYFILIAAILFSSCNSSNIMNGSNPNKASFKYYDPNFKLEASSNLKLDRKYYFKHPGSENVNILIFFSDGFLNKYFTTGINAVSGKRAETGVIMGYFETRKDSIFFTIKSYYEHRPTSYEGRIMSDTLDLKVKYPGNKASVLEKYALYKN